MRLSRDLLIRGIIYQLQERAYGGLSKATARKLEQAAAYPPGRGAAKPTPPISLRPGTRLVREWRGVTHMVLIHADGIEWRGQRYRSLSDFDRSLLHLVDIVVLNETELGFMTRRSLHESDPESFFIEAARTLQMRDGLAMIEGASGCERIAPLSPSPQDIFFRRAHTRYVGNTFAETKA
jgi:hypothetical protein